MAWGVVPKLALHSDRNNKMYSMSQGSGSVGDAFDDASHVFSNIFTASVIKQHEFVINRVGRANKRRPQ